MIRDVARKLAVSAIVLIANHIGAIGAGLVGFALGWFAHN